MSTKNLIGVLCAMLCCTGAWAEKWAPVPITVLAQRADLVVTATVNSIVDDNSPDARVQLGVVRVVKGTPSALTVIAGMSPPRSAGSAKYVLPTTFVGKTGLWFLKSGPSGVYIILPRVNGAYSKDDAFFAVEDQPASAVAKLNEQVLAYAVRWYSSLQNPTGRDDLLFLASFDGARPDSQNVNRQDMLGALNPLIGSTSLVQHLMGLAAALRLGSDDQIGTILNELPSLGSHVKFHLVEESIGAYPHSSASVQALQNIAKLHTAVPGLDDSVSTALMRMGTKVVLPAMAELLDSQDPRAQRRAASFFATYSLFADANGNVSGGGPEGPFASADTKQFTPQANTGITTAQYAQFWKTWWAANSAKLGFAIQ